MRLLVEYGAEVDVNSMGNHEGMPLLSRLVLSSQYQLVCLVLERNPGVIERVPPWNWTVLREACFHGLQDMLELLLDKGAILDRVVVQDPLKPERSGWTELMHAAANNHPSIVLTLLEHGAELERTDSRGRTALWIAVDHGADCTACLLLSKGASVGAKDRTGVSVQRQAEIRGATPEFLASVSWRTSPEDNTARTDAAS